LKWDERSYRRIQSEEEEEEDDDDDDNDLFMPCYLMIIHGRGRDSFKH
jgi:hypothetical protein